MRTVAASLVLLSLTAIGRAAEPTGETLDEAPPAPAEATPEAAPAPRARVVRVESSAEALHVGVLHHYLLGRCGRTSTEACWVPIRPRFEAVCKTPCEVKVPDGGEPGLEVQVRNSVGVPLTLDSAAYDRASVVVQPPERARVRAGAGLLAVGILSALAGGLAIPFGRDLFASSSDVSPVTVGNSAGGLAIGAGMASTIAGVILIAKSAPKLKRVDRPAAERDRAAIARPRL